jgi:thiamine biosynthesis lipoprotein
LRGESAIDAIGELADGTAPQNGGPLRADSPAESASRKTGAYLIEVSREAMACKFAVYLNAGQHSHAAEAAVESLDRVALLEDQLTVYREHSEVSRLNRTAAAGPVAVEAGLFSLLRRAVEIHRQTAGAFDITAGPLSKVWGFHRRAGSVPDDAELAEALSRVGSQWLEFDERQGTLRFARPGVELNLGGIGKGYALDVCARQLEQAGVGDFLFHGGHSSVLARGARIGPLSPTGPGSEDGGWTVGVVHPLRPERRLAEVVLRNRALGTSGSAMQSFYHQGKRYGHILDPRSGRPADALLSATVIAPSAADADALATACYVLGVEAALAHCARHPELSALLVAEGSRRGAIELHSANLAERDWRRLED